MKKFSLPILSFTFALVLACFFSWACTRQDGRNPTKSQAPAASAVAAPVGKKQQSKDMQIDPAADDADLDRKNRQWETVQDVALQVYDTCLENCGNSEVCMDNCEKAYVLRLAAEYKILLHE